MKVILAPMELLPIELDADSAGDWMIHCHNIYHAEAGMMIGLRYVKEPLGGACAAGPCIARRRSLDKTLTASILGHHVGGQLSKGSSQPHQGAIMEPNFPYTRDYPPDLDTFTNYTPPLDPVQSAGTPEPGMETVPGLHAGHHWMHLLMFAPMLLIVGYLVLAGKVGEGAIVYALGCLAMMGVMMAMMNHGTTDHSGTHASGHRH